MNKQGHTALLKKCSVIGGFGYVCVHCRREFRMKTTMSNHLGACTLLHMDARDRDRMGETVVYTHAQLSRQVETLARQMRFMQEEIKKLTLVKKKRITVLHWLNARTPSGECIRASELNSTEFWDTCRASQAILRDEVFTDSLLAGITRIIQDAIENAGGKGVVPLRCFTIKPDVVYHFTEQAQWEQVPVSIFDQWIMKIGHGFMQLMQEPTGNIDTMVENMKKIMKWSDPRFIQTVKKWVRGYILQEIENIHMVEISVHDN